MQRAARAARGTRRTKGESMTSRRWYWAAGVTVLAALLLAAAAGAMTRSAGKTESAKLTKVTLQLKWVAQAQFAGYYAAKAKGYYKQVGLDVSLRLGGPTITPELVVQGKQAEFGIDWLPSLLAFRDKGANLVNISQVFSRSGMTELTWRDSGIKTIKQLRGKKVGVWCCGNENELYAALVKNGLDPKKDVQIVNQPFDMNLFLKRQVDAAAAMTYNELAQVLEQKNPKTGKLYTLNDLNVIKMEGVGTGMLEDGIFARGDWLSSASNRATATKFLGASLKGWAYCRDKPSDCVKIVLANGPALPKGHQTWQMNEINALTWPATTPVGVMNAAAFNRTARIAKQFKVIKKTPSGAYRTDLAKAAVAMLKKQHVDVLGKGWHKATIKLTPGGK
jgi:NitT/TauT family transport system substrate-binding protein